MLLLQTLTGCNLPMSTKQLLDSAKKLSQAERLLLVEELWNSIANDPSEPQLSKSQKSELDRRIDRLEETGPTGDSWAKVKHRLLKKRR